MEGTGSATDAAPCLSPRGRGATPPDGLAAGSARGLRLVLLGHDEPQPKGQRTRPGYPAGGRSPTPRGVCSEGARKRGFLSPRYVFNENPHNEGLPAVTRARMRVREGRMIARPEKPTRTAQERRKARGAYLGPNRARKTRLGPIQGPARPKAGEPARETHQNGAGAPKSPGGIPRPQPGQKNAPRADSRPGATVGRERRPAEQTAEARGSERENPPQAGKAQETGQRGSSTGCPHLPAGTTLRPRAEPAPEHSDGLPTARPSGLGPWTTLQSENR